MRYINIAALGVLPVLTLGCASSGIARGISSPLSGMAMNPSDSATGSLAILSWTGGLSILAGMACLIITSGRMGIRGVVGGVLLVLVNFAVNRYAHLIFIPMIIGTGLISLSWSYFQIKKVWKEKKQTASPAPAPVVQGDKKKWSWSFWRKKQ
jgi:hypothetical protein